MEIRLNAKFFETEGPITRVPIQEFSDAFRTTGQQQRHDRSLTPSVALDWSDGIGFRKSSDKLSLWYSSCETRFPGQITLPALLQSDTRHANMDDTMRGVVNFNGKAHCIAHNTANTNYWGIFSYSAGTWSQEAQDTSPAVGTTTPLDLAIHKNLLVCIASIPTTGGTDLRFATWDGTSLVTTVPTGLPTASIGTEGVVASDGANIYVVVRSGTEVGVYVSTDNGASFPTKYITYTAPSGPIGKAIYYNQDGGLDLWVCDKDTLRVIDLSTARINDLQVGPFQVDGGTADDSRNRLIVHQGRLYAIGSREVWEYSWNGSALIERRIGLYTFRDFLPTSQWSNTANFTGACTMGKWLIVGSTNTTNTAGLLAFDTLKDAWHMLPGYGVALGFVGSTLHMSLSAANTRFLAEADKNSLSINNFAYGTTGKIWTSHFDGGLPETNARWLRLVEDNEDMTATETAVMKYGADYAVPSTSTGATFNNTTTSFNFGSSLGVSAKTLGLEYVFNRSATNTLSPKKHPSILYYEKVFTARYAFSFVVDLEATARRLRSTPDAVEKDLDTVLDSVPLVTLSYGRLLTDGGAYNVAPIPQGQFWQFQSRAMGENRPPLGEERGGLVRVFLAERL